MIRQLRAEVPLILKTNWVPEDDLKIFSSSDGIESTHEEYVLWWFSVDIR